jgi:hypothetical protein
MSSTESSTHLPDPLAIQLFHTLALSSRQNAQEIEEHVDCLLQYITLPSTSSYPPSLTINLLVSTLRLHANLVSYGLHCHIAGTAVTQFAQLEQNVISEVCTSHSLVIVWANLVEVWTIYAIDPIRRRQIMMSFGVRSLVGAGTPVSRSSLFVSVLPGRIGVYGQLYGELRHPG